MNNVGVVSRLLICLLQINYITNIVYAILSTLNEMYFKNK
ncbi:MAG: hypothetical protein BWY18_00751 [Candidatus Cloacimonetes bacterium ADurb.Bin211]|nr:MAG: hypothetical protein BWY18_00751 [Candidatus Cloacimonetes bacterium ADurb.Bin211]